MNLFAGAVWAVFLLVLYTILSGVRRPLQWPRRRAGLFIFLLALLVRLVPVALLSTVENYDIESYRIVAEAFNGGEDVYASTAGQNRHPYLPLMVYWMGFAHWLSSKLPLPFPLVVRLLPVFADALLALVLYRRAARRVEPSLPNPGLLYAIQPVAVFVSAYHGQFDAVAGLLILLAISSSSARPWLQGLWLGLGILVKSWPVLAFPVMVTRLRRNRARLLFILGVGAIPLAGVLLYSTIRQVEVMAILQRAAGYNQGVGVWGIAYLVRLLLVNILERTDIYAWFIQLARYGTLALLGLVWWKWARHQDDARGVRTMLLAFLALTHAFAVQYLQWIVPFGLDQQELRWMRRFTLAAFAYMFLVYFTLIFTPLITNLLPWPQADLWIIIPAGIPVWLVCTGWLLKTSQDSRQP